MKGIKKMKQFTISQKIYMGVKRVIDILLSALALILLSWLFLILCIVRRAGIDRYRRKDTLRTLTLQVTS